MNQGNLDVDVIKHDGRRPSEDFQTAKLRSSLIAACLSVKTPRGQAETIADQVIDAVTTWLQKKPEVTSRDIRHIAGKHLETHHPEAAYMYQQYHHTL